MSLLPNVCLEAHTEVVLEQEAPPWPLLPPLRLVYVPTTSCISLSFLRLGIAQPADGHIMIYLSSRAHMCGNSNVSWRKSCFSMTGDCCGGTVILFPVTRGWISLSYVSRTQLWRHSTWQEVRLMKCSTEWSLLSEIYLAFTLQVFWNAEFDLCSPILEIWETI